MSEADKRMAAFTLERMLKGTFFSIVAVNEAAALMGRSVSGPIYRRLHALHCVPWGDIPDDIIALLPIWINEALGGPRVSVVQIPALLEGRHDLPQIEDEPRRLR